jgi:hypothetical protein
LKYDGQTILSVQSEDGIHVDFRSLQNAKCPIFIEVFGDRGYCRLEFSNPFDAFKRDLEEFIGSIRKGGCVGNEDPTLNVIRIIEMGRG